MSEKNETTVRRLMDDVWTKGNVKLLDELITSDHVNHNALDPGRGLEAARNSVKKYRTAFPDCRLDIDELLSVGDKVVVRWRYSGTHRGPLEGLSPTGKRVNGTGITIHRFVGDKIQESFDNWDALALMQQLGVVTLPGRTSSAGM